MSWFHCISIFILAFLEIRNMFEMHSIVIKNETADFFLGVGSIAIVIQFDGLNPKPPL